MADDTISYWDWESRSLRALLKDFFLFLFLFNPILQNQFRIIKIFFIKSFMNFIFK